MKYISKTGAIEVDAIAALPTNMKDVEHFALSMGAQVRRIRNANYLFLEVTTKNYEKPVLLSDQNDYLVFTKQESNGITYDVADVISGFIFEQFFRKQNE